MRIVGVVIIIKFGTLLLDLMDFPTCHLQALWEVTCTCRSFTGDCLRKALGIVLANYLGKTRYPSFSCIDILEERLN